MLVGAHLLAAGVFAFALYGILRAILVKQASGDAIFGAICGYLLLGIIWSLLYSAVETATPGSFNMSTSMNTDAAPTEQNSGAKVVVAGKAMAQRSARQRSPAFGTVVKEVASPRTRRQRGKRTRAD